MENIKKWDLATISAANNALDIFCAGGVEDIIKAIEDEVSGLVFDVTTPRGRKDIASLAYKVSQSKTALDALGKGLVAEWKNKSKAVDDERKTVRDRLDALRDKIRQPLTEWEAEEAARIESERLQRQLDADHDQAIIENDLFDRMREIARREEIIRLAQEKADSDERARQDAINAAAKAADEAAAQVKRDEAIRAKAAEDARIAAEQKAAREIEEANKKAIQAKISEDRAKQATIEAEKKAAQDLIDQAKRLAEEAQKKEADRLMVDEAHRKEEERRRSDIIHRRAVNAVILDAMIKHGLDREMSKCFLRAVISGEIDNIKVVY